VTTGTIDCDCHPDMPDTRTVLPNTGDFWRTMFVERRSQPKCCSEAINQALEQSASTGEGWCVAGLLIAAKQRPDALDDAVRN
jgi:hypothetical protein